MRKHITLAIALVLSLNIFAQEQDSVQLAINNQVDSMTNAQALQDSLLLDNMKRHQHMHYINFYFGGGANSIYYKPSDGKYSPGIGGDFRLQYQYMANRNWGFSISAQASVYQSSAVYNYTYTQKNLIHPDNGKRYDLSLTFQDWREKQLLVQVEVPIMFNFMADMSPKSQFSLAAGLSIAFPVYNTYKTTEGTYQTTGYFYDTNEEYANLDNHGFVSTKYGVNGTSNFNLFNVGALLDLGFNFAMTPRSDFYIGLYGGYYFLNSIKPIDQNLVTIDSKTGAMNYVGSLASDRMQQVNPFNAGIRLGFRFRVDHADRRHAEYAERLKQARLDKAELERLRLQHIQDSINALNAADNLRRKGESEEEYRLRLAREQAAKDSIDDLFRRLQIEHDSLLRKKAEVVERKRIAGHINNVAHFDTAKDFPYIDEEAQQALYRLAQLMRENPNVWVMVFGHADNTGSHDKNIIYGQRRAEAMRNVLVKYGADFDRIICVSRGDDDPVASNDTEEGRRLNRRAEIDITEK